MNKAFINDLTEYTKFKDIAPPEQSEIEKAENIFRSYGLKV